MDTNKHTAIRKLDNGMTIEVTIERGTWAEQIYLDGQATGSIKVHTVNQTTIALRDASGKQLASGSELSALPKSHPHLTAAKKAGCIAWVPGTNLFARPAVADAIKSALDEANAAAPKTAKQIEIEAANAKARAQYDAWHSSPEQVAARKFAHDFGRADSDY